MKFYPDMLIDACIFGDTDKVKEYGQLVSLRDLNIALKWAVDAKHADVVAILVGMGARNDIMWYKNSTPEIKELLLDSMV